MLTSAGLYFREAGPIRGLAQELQLALFLLHFSQPTFWALFPESQSLTSSGDGKGIPQVACGSVKPQWPLLPDFLAPNEIPGIYHFISLLLINKYQQGMRYVIED